MDKSIAFRRDSGRYVDRKLEQLMGIISTPFSKDLVLNSEPDVQILPEP